MNLHELAIKWGWSIEELRDVQATLGTYTPPIPVGDVSEGKSESWAQSAVRLEASRKGVYLFRNNVGALKDATGRVVRFGLGNDSASLNDVLKSHDLIGFRPTLVRPEHVGQTWAKFTSREIKEPGWQYRGDPHERAQLAFGNLVNSCGGDAAFATGEGTL